jgi:iron complex outermembrane receptor protein
MTANWAVFYTEYDDLQTSIFKGIGFGVTNAAETTVQGIEADFMWQATEELRLGLNLAYLDSEYDTYLDAPCNAQQVDASRGAPGGTPLCGQDIPGNVDPDGNLIINNDLSGETTTFAPDWSGAFFFDYSLLLKSGMEFFAGGEANYTDEFSTQGDNDQLDFADDYVKVNLRIGLRGARDDWEVMLYGRNITDEEVYIYSFDVPVLAGSHAAMIDEGEVYGARFRYNF